MTYLRLALRALAYASLLAAPAAAQGPPIGTPYCTSNPSDTGIRPTIQAFGSAVVADRDVTLIVENCDNAVSILFFGTTQIQVPFNSQVPSAGYRCVGGQLKRVFPLGLPSTNRFTRVLDFDAPYAQPIVAGASLNFQLWQRIAHAGMSDAVNVQFQ